MAKSPNLIRANTDPRPAVGANWIVGISGASGTVYARRMLEVIATSIPELTVDVVVSDGALRVLQEEENLFLSNARLTAENFIGQKSDRIRFLNNKDTGASIASGSHPVTGMIIVPCSMNTLAAIATGFADTLLRRAADVTLKEGRKLILVPRETPLHTRHLEQLTALSRMGVQIVPAMPGFYNRPASISELVDMFVQRLFDHMGYTVTIAPRWQVEERKKLFVNAS